ncbi:MAG: malate dehydrogenase [Candidatus Omnitrophica bacterium]|nr:malate dehydrogenase [Candidatus Omnitrophota bacterium]
MKVSIIGAGNVGGTLAQRISEAGLADVVLLDIAEGLAKGKGFDLSDARSITSKNHRISGTSDYNEIRDSTVVVVTAGLARVPGMTREDLLKKNAAIIKKVIYSIAENAPDSIIVMVTNPLDILTNLALHLSKFSPQKVIGMGGVLDSARFANLIAEHLDVPVTSVEALVIGAHSKDMIPLAGFSKVSGKPLTQIVSAERCRDLSLATAQRGAQIVACLGQGSAYYAPSAAAFKMVKAIIGSENIVVPACVYCNGEYGIEDTCIGVPARLGSRGVEEIIELDLKVEEKEKLLNSAKFIKEAAANLA